MGLSGRSKAIRFQIVRLCLVTCLHICFLGVFASPAKADTLTLSFPLRCTLHETCFIQKYVDTDPSPDAQAVKQLMMDTRAQISASFRCQMQRKALL